MAEEARQGRSIKIRPSVLRKAHHRAIESQKRLGHWVEEAIEEKAAREEREKQPK
jgi:predicted HicB family RNase H-like nuclease